MAFEVNTGATSIKFGQTLGIGYRTYGSITPFTPVAHYPGADELPYTFRVPSAGIWEIEYTTLCANCSGGIVSDPDTAVVTVSQ